MISKTQQFVKQAQQILIQNGEQSSIRIRSLLNNDISIYILSMDQISTTMLLSQRWDKTGVEDKTVLVFTARQQRSGKGQKNNGWSSPPGNIYMTILTKQNVEVVPYIFMIVTVAISNTLHDNYDIGEDIKLKWVNDMVIKDHKIGGVLVKSDILANHIYLQIGIGINIMQKPIQTSTCLVEHLKQHKNISGDDMDQLIQKISIAIINQFKHVKQHNLLINEYNQRLLFKNQTVNIYDNQLTNVLQTGKFIGINPYGFAILQSQDGTTFQVTDGRMRKS